MSSLFKNIQPQSATHVPEPPIARFLFADTRMAWVWLIVRLYVAYEWFTAGWEKLTGTNIDFTSSTFGQKGSAWVFNSLPNNQQMMYFFATSAAKEATGAHPAVQQWYANLPLHLCRAQRHLLELSDHLWRTGRGAGAGRGVPDRDRRLLRAGDELQLLAGRCGEHEPDPGLPGADAHSGLAHRGLLWY